MELKHILHALGHEQKTTNIKTDNSTALSYCKDTLKPKRSLQQLVRELRPMIKNFVRLIHENQKRKLFFDRD